MLGFVEHLAPRYFAPAYFGRRYFALPIPASHSIEVGAVIREVAVQGRGVEPGLPAQGRSVTVVSVNRWISAPSAVRMVSAVTPEREVDA